MRLRLDFSIPSNKAISLAFNTTYTAFSFIFSVVLSMAILAQARSQEPLKIIGRNNLVTVKADASNIPIKYRGLVDGISAIEFVEKYSNGDINGYIGCTGTHIGNGYVITAGHCFVSDDSVVEKGSCSFVKKDPLVGNMNLTIGEVRWGYRQGQPSVLVSRCEEIVYAKKSEDGSDFGIMKVSPAPEVVIPIEMNLTPKVGDILTVFSHADGEPLHWSQRCQVESDTYPGISNNFLRHKCDTTIGSSGAALIDIRTLKIVGIHDGGILDTDEFGIPFKQRTGMNYGTYIQYCSLQEKLKELGFK